MRTFYDRQFANERDIPQPLYGYRLIKSKYVELIWIRKEKSKTPLDLIPTYGFIIIPTLTPQTKLKHYGTIFNPMPDSYKIMKVLILKDSALAPTFMYESHLPKNLWDCITHLFGFRYSLVPHRGRIKPLLECTLKSKTMFSGYVPIDESFYKL